MTGAERAVYERVVQPDFNNPLPYAQGPRHMGTDKRVVTRA